MKFIQDFFGSPVGIAIISIVWGLGVASLFKKPCIEPQCQVVEYRSPDAVEIRDKAFIFGENSDECYRYQPYAVRCPNQS